MESYDEDLTENGWYICLCQKHDDLFQKASNERWMICVPQQGTWKSGIEDGDLFSQKYFESHILKPVVLYLCDDTETSPQNKFMTFNGKEVLIEGSTILCGSGFVNKHQKPSYDSRSETLDLQLQECHSAQILFEETFFNQNDESYQVVCISQPLEQDLVQSRIENSDAEEDASDLSLPVSMWEACGTFVWTKATNPSRAKSTVDEKIIFFNSELKNTPYSYIAMSGNLGTTTKELQSLSKRVLKLLATCFQLLQRDIKLRKFCEIEFQLDELKSALESYVQYGIYDNLLLILNDLFSSQDCLLNRTTRNLQAVKLSDLQVREQFWSGVPAARRELSLLDHFHTPKDKLSCLQKVVMFVTQQDTFRSRISGQQHSSSERQVQRTNSALNMTTQTRETVAMSSDDLLPILIYLVVKCDINHWLANINYLKYFNFTKSPQDKLGFYLATLEAAVEHVRNGNLVVDKVRIKAQRQNSSANAEQLGQFFKLVSDGDVSAVDQFLNQADNLRRLYEHAKCHPLCECPKCVRISPSGTPGTSGVDVRVTSRDDNGRTALHITALAGKHEVIDTLIKHDADLNACDYHGSTPLHLAAQAGSQSVIFLLLHYGATADAGDNNSNTALHLACIGGHDGCVKALLFFDPTAMVVKVNAANDAGDTALHIAARWGYGRIVHVLMEYKADPAIKNRRGRTPCDVSHNTNINNILQMTEFEFVNVSRYREPPPIKKQSSGAGIGSKVVRATPAGDHANRPRGYSTHAREPDEEKNEASRQVEKMLRAVADHDLNMMNFLCGWTTSSGQSQGGAAEKCHPLCQCSKCSPPMEDPVLHANVVGTDGLTPLMIASKMGYQDIVRALLCHNAKTDIKLKGKGHTSLHFACQYGHCKIAEMLLEQGAYYDIRDNEGNTPIFMASTNGHNSCIRVLIEHGASVNIRNHRGDSPLHEAVKWKHVATVRLLIERDAMVYYKNSAGRTPLDMSEQEPGINEILLRVAKGQQSVETLSPSNARSKVARPTSLIGVTADTRKSMSQSEADEALADELLNRFSASATPETPPAYDFSSSRSYIFDECASNVVDDATDKEGLADKTSLALFENASASASQPDLGGTHNRPEGGSQSSIDRLRGAAAGNAACTFSEAPLDNQDKVLSGSKPNRSDFRCDRDPDVDRGGQKMFESRDIQRRFATPKPVTRGECLRGELNQSDVACEGRTNADVSTHDRTNRDYVVTDVTQAAHSSPETCADVRQVAVATTASPPVAVENLVKSSPNTKAYFEISSAVTTDALRCVGDVGAQNARSGSLVSDAVDHKDGLYLAVDSVPADGE